MFEDILADFQPYLEKRYPGDRSVLKRDPSLHSRIIQATQDCPPNLMLRGRVELLRRGLTTIPPCPVCQKPIRFMTDVYRWSEVCSVRCAVINNYTERGDEIRSKQVSTMVERYGVEYPAQLEDFLEKYKETSRGHWGADHHLKSPEGLKKFEDTLESTLGFRNVLYDPKVKEKIQATILEKFGVDNPAKAEVVKKKRMETLRKRFGEDPYRSEEFREAYRQTSLKNWGYDNPLKSPVLRRRIREILLNKFGVPNVFFNPEIFKKACDTLQKRYGARRPGSISRFARAGYETCQKRYGVSNPGLIPEVIQSNHLRAFDPEVLRCLESLEFWKDEYSRKGKSLLQISRDLHVSDTTVAKYFKLHNLALRPSIFGYEEQTLRDFIEQYYPTTKTTLKKLGGDSNLQLDVYIPELKLAFEYNGLEWHQEKYRDSKYHLNKTVECQKLGIRLIHVWSDDWNLKRSLMEKKIQVLIGRSSQSRVFARNCRVIIPDHLDRIIFYDENHIKGDGAGKVSYALEHEGILVAMITFKRELNGVWDLNRYATSGSVVGGFTKLLKHFQRNHPWAKIYTYADRCWSVGDLYYRAGFTMVSETEPSYHGVEFGRRIYWGNYTHQNMAKKFPEFYDPDRSISEMMDLAGIPRVWDCGNLRFELENPEVRV